MQYTKSIKIITCNVNGLGNPIKRSKIMAKLKRKEIDVAVLHLPDPEHEKLKRWGFNQYSSSYRHGSKRGVVIFILRKLNFVCTYVKKDPHGRYVLISSHLQVALVSVNVRLHATLEHQKHATQEKKKVTKNIQLMRELGLSDIWRDLNPTKRDFSHLHSVYSWLDYYLMFQRDMCRVTNCSTGIMDLSDHAPVECNIGF
uniref:Endonuclease/exonuclease/phosphatase domain-containing protein n=1 Tax=Amphilophus citrinellus TaxID=61819 RepID=A0A3Q0RRB4_AMPCI